MNKVSIRTKGQRWEGGSAFLRGRLGEVEEVGTHSFWVVVLANFGGFLEVAINLCCGTETDSLEVKDGTRCLNQFPGFSRAGRLNIPHHKQGNTPRLNQQGQERGGGHYKTWIGKLFIFTDKILQESFLCGDRIHGVKINLSKLLNVHWSSVLSKVSFISKQEVI
jgi:hypothetical protein